MSTPTTTYRSEYIPLMNRLSSKQFASATTNVTVCEKCQKPLSECELISDTTEINSSKPKFSNVTDDSSKNHNIIEKPSEILTHSSASSYPTCAEDSQNRYLKILRTCYPDLYQRLEKFPNNELSRRLEVERLRTSYQRIFCVLPKFPDGIYRSMEQEEDKIKNKCMSFTNDDCSQFTADLDVTRRLKTLINQPKPDYFEPKSVDRLPKKIHVVKISNPNISEYRDVICRTGCVIQENHIHDHSKCGKSCAHVLKANCRTYK